MNVTTNRLELLALAKGADSIAPTKCAVDALTYTMLEAQADGMLVVSATNLEVSLERKMQTQVQEPGALLIPARLLADMLKLLPEEQVTICGNDGGQVTLHSGQASYTFSTLDTKEFPRMEFPFPEDTVPVTGIPAITKRTAFAVAEDEKEAVMRCIHLQFTSDGLRAAGCDGMRLAAAKGDSNSVASVNLLIPASSMEKLARLVSNKDVLRVGTTGRTAVFSKEDFRFSARLVEGRYMNTDQMLESLRSSFTVLTDVSTLQNTLTSVTMVAGQNTALELRFQNSLLTIRMESENGTAEQEVQVIPLSGTPQGEFWYNHIHLSQCLRALNGTLMLEVGQGGVLLLKTDELVCLQTARRKPNTMEQSKKEKPPKAA